MPTTKSRDLHGNAPDKHSTALVLVDVISDFNFEDGDKLLENAVPAAKRIAELKRRAKAARVPVVYANDNFGIWQSDFSKLLKHCQSKSAKGCRIAKLLAPNSSDYFILKPKHSGFYSTTLDLLLEHFKAKKLIIAGFSTDICVLFTASDAYLRDYKIIIPRDCVAAVEMSEHEHALELMRRVLKADTRESSDIELK